MAGIQQVSFTSPYAAEESEIERRRRLAEMLQAQSQAPMGGTESVGGWAIKRSPWEGVGRIAQAGFGGLAAKEADEKARDLATRASSERRMALAEALRKAQGSAPSYEDAAGNYAPQPGQAPDMMGALSTLAGSNDPMLSQFGAQGMLARFVPKDPNAMIGKIDPKDYTPESFAKFVQTSDPTQLRPRVRQEAVNAGDKTVFFDPYAPPTAPIPHGMKPGENARLLWDQYQFNNIGAKDRVGFGLEAGRLANQGAETQFSTGSGTTGPVGMRLPPNAPMPQFGAGAPFAPTQNLGAPMNGPQPVQQMQPPSAPQPVTRPPVPVPAGAVPPGAAPVNLPPRVLAEIEAAKRKQANELAGKREFNMGGITEALDTAQRILEGKGPTVAGIQTAAPKPTQSVFGSIYDKGGTMIGRAPEGAAQADQLRAIGGALVAKVPRMEGPQSNLDVELYRQMAGDIGNDRLPISRRLEALKTVRQLYAKYEHLNGGAAQNAAPKQDNDPLGLRQRR